MLVLSRKVGQSIVIGDGIEITVVELRGDQVRLGIHAPREVPVNRKEVLERCCVEPLSQSGEAAPPSDSAHSSSIEPTADKGAAVLAAVA